QECLICARAYRNQTALRSALKDSSLSYPAPAKLQKRVRSALHQANKAETPSRATAWRWLAVGASLACALLIAFVIWSALPGRFTPSRDELLAQEIVSVLSRCLWWNNLTDVPSSTHHTANPWSNGK